MARKYRIDRDDKVEIKKTQSSFSDDPKLNKAKQINGKCQKDTYPDGNK